jgi:hypothetical protein
MMVLVTCMWSGTDYEPSLWKSVLMPIMSIVLLMNCNYLFFPQLNKYMMF